MIPAYVLLTLAGAGVHAFSFVLSKRFWLYARDPFQIAAMSQLSCALGASVLLPWVGFGPLLKAPWTLLGVATTALVGQVLFIQALRRGDASFVVPMLGFKLFAVAGFAAVFLGERYGPLVYLGCFGAFASLFLLSDGRLRGSLSSAVLVIAASSLFGAADVMILSALRAGVSPVATAVYCMVLPALVLTPLVAWLTPRRWQVSVPFARSLALYATLHLAGLSLLMTAFVLADRVTIVNVVQTVRGLFVVAVVYGLGRAGVSGIERMDLNQLRVRLVGAALMAGSVALAVLSQPR